MPYQVTTLLQYQPSTHKSLSQGCSVSQIFNPIDPFKLVMNSLPFVYQTKCIRSDNFWQQLVLVEAANVAVYFFADYFNKFMKKEKELEEDPLVFTQNFLAQWQRIQTDERFKLLSDVINLLLKGQLLNYPYKSQIILPSLTLVEEPEQVHSSVKEFYDRIEAASKMTIDMYNYLVKVFCECPFFQYWGPYFLTNSIGNGLLAQVASSIFSEIEIPSKIDVGKYKNIPRTERLVRKQVKWKTEQGFIPKYVQYLNPIRALGAVWSAFKLCKHLYRVLNIERYKIRTAYSRVVDNLNKVIQPLIMRRLRKSVLLKQDSKLIEFVWSSSFQHILEHNLNEFSEIGVTVSELVQPGVSYYLGKDVTIPRFNGAIQSSAIELPKGSYVFYCCKLRGPEPPFYRFVGVVNKERIEFDIPEPEVTIILSKLEPMVKQWKGKDLPDYSGWGVA